MNLVGHLRKHRSAGRDPLIHASPRLVLVVDRAVGTLRLRTNRSTSRGRRRRCHRNYLVGRLGTSHVSPRHVVALTPRVPLCAHLPAVAPFPPRVRCSRAQLMERLVLLSPVLGLRPEFF